MNHTLVCVNIQIICYLILQFIELVVQDDVEEQESQQRLSTRPVVC